MYLLIYLFNYKNKFGFANYINQTNNSVIRKNKIGDNGAKYIGESMTKLKNI